MRFPSYLHRLSSLLCICQQLDGDGPAVLNSILQVNKSVAYVTAHAALPADGHRARFAEEQKDLRNRKRTEKFSFVSELNDKQKRATVRLQTTAVLNLWLKAPFTC